MDLFRFASIAAPHAVSTRHGGVSDTPYATLNVGYGTDDSPANVAANRRLLLESMGLNGHSVIGARLVHGNAVSVFRDGESELFPLSHRPTSRGSAQTEPAFLTDAAVSDVSGLHFLLTAADCVPLLFHDPDRAVVGVAHAGWRGTAGQIAARTLRVMIDGFGCSPRSIRAGIGPSIGPCCYDVGEDVHARFAAHNTDAVTNDDKLDLWETNRRQITAVGVESVELAALCTSCCSDIFFSHRRENGLTGRFALVAGLA